MKKYFKYIIGILIFGLIFFPLHNIASTDEAIKLIQVKDQLINNGYNVAYLNALGNIIIGSGDNSNLSIFSNFKDKIFLNKENSYVSSSLYDSQGRLLNGGNSNVSVGGDFINGVNDYYSEERIAPKDPTSILPINTPCDVYNMQGKGVRFSNTNAYSSLGSYDDDLLKIDLSKFVKAGNTLSGTLYLDLFISDINVVGKPKNLELSNVNNTQGIMYGGDLCAYASGGTCKNGLNTVSLPISSLNIASASATDWSNLRHLEFYSSTGVNVNMNGEILILESVYFSDDLHPKEKVSNYDLASTGSWLQDKSVLAYNCKTFSTTDINPIFVSYFENGDMNINGGYTIVELRKKSNNDFVNSFYIGDSKKGDTYVKPAKNKSYTYGIYSQQDRSNLYNPLYGGNLNLKDGITTSSYNPLTLGSYVVYMQNINSYGFRSSRIPVGYLNIVPPEAGVVFDYINITNPATSNNYAVVSGYAYINFDKNIKVNLTNPAGYEYGVTTINGKVVSQSSTGFVLDSLPNGNNLVTVSVKDISGNTIATRPLIIVVDTVSPIIHTADVDSSYVGLINPDNTVAMVHFQGKYHVNDNIFSVGSKKVPFVSNITDNIVSDITIQYSLNSTSGFNNVIDQSSIEPDYKFNIDTSFIANDGVVDLYIRAVDKAGNISLPIKVSYFSNRSAQAPIILTNGGSGYITNSESSTFNFEMENDILKFLINDDDYPWFNKLSANLTLKIPLRLGDNNYNFSVVDILGNKSPTATFGVQKNPTPKEGVDGEDQTIYFRNGVKSNAINLQRVTSDGSPAEVFSR